MTACNKEHQPMQLPATHIQPVHCGNGRNRMSYISGQCMHDSGKYANLLTPNCILTNNSVKKDFPTNTTQYTLNGNRINISINNTVLQALVDTGANISIINESTFNMLNNTESKDNCRLESDIETCTLADDTLIDIVAMVYLTVNLNGSHIESKFYILRNSHEKVIIGCDFLRRFEGNINFKDNT